MGKISKKWSKLYLLKIENDEEAEEKAEVFGRNIINGIWRYTLSVRGIHNENVHDRNK